MQHRKYIERKETKLDRFTFMNVDGWILGILLYDTEVVLLHQNFWHSNEHIFMLC